MTKGVYQLDDLSGSIHTRAQVFASGDPQAISWVYPVCRIDRRRAQQTFSLVAHRPDAEPNPARGITLRSVGQNVRVDFDQKMLTEYRVDSGSKPILFPLIGPTGDSYTRGFPMETLPDEDNGIILHQRSCWFTYGSVNGVDFWSRGAKAGTIKETHRTIESGGTGACAADFNRRSFGSRFEMVSRFAATSGSCRSTAPRNHA